MSEDKFEKDVNQVEQIVLALVEPMVVEVGANAAASGLLQAIVKIAHRSNKMLAPVMLNYCAGSLALASAALTNQRFLEAWVPEGKTN
jgi:cyanate permease